MFTDINIQRADELTQNYTAFTDFIDMVVNTNANYRPSLNCSHGLYGRDLVELADLYDRAQGQRCDVRRAFRF